MSEPVRERDRVRRSQGQDAQAQPYGWFPFALIGVLVVIGVGLIVYGMQSAGGPPRLQVDREVIDLGDQHLDTTVRATFKITNTGDGVLTLNVPKTPTVVEGC